MGPVGKNFALQMLKLHLERNILEVVSDQVGCPTSTLTLAKACWKLIQRSTEGQVLPSIMHWCDAGAASWYDVAFAVGELGKQNGLLNSPARLVPIKTSQYPALARRPNYSLLDIHESIIALEIEPLHWRTALEQFLRLRSEQASKER